MSTITITLTDEQAILVRWALLDYETEQSYQSRQNDKKFDETRNYKYSRLAEKQIDQVYKAEEIRDLITKEFKAR